MVASSRAGGHPLLELAEIISAGLFTGGAIYINVAEAPARSSIDDPLSALKQWRESYSRAAPWQAGNAAVCLAAGFVNTLVAGGDVFWGIAGAVVGSVLPLTLLVIKPINKRLQSGKVDADEVKMLLSKWSRLHAIRSGLGMAGFLLMGYLTVTTCPPARSAKTL